MTDRVLTVQQPWASAIIRAGKNIENRTWDTSYRGRVWIHAGLTHQSGHRLPIDPDQLLIDRGKIIGYVDLVDVVTNSRSRWALPGHYHWVFEDPRPCRPVPWRGAQGLQMYHPRGR